VSRLPDTDLTPVQFEILQVAWNASDGASVAEIWETISAGRDVGRTTILNLVDRLEKRGWLSRRKIDGVFRYRPTVDRETATGHVAAEFVDSFFSGSASDLVMSLLGSRRISPAEIEELRTRLGKKTEPKPRTAKSKETRK
jgi:BlaI family transcriptional regulator, penicillinase repressor